MFFSSRLALLRVGLLLVTGALLFNACTDDEKEIPRQPETTAPTTAQVLVLHQGNQATKLPGGYSLIDTQRQSVTANAFLAHNGKQLGETPQEAILHGTKIYIPCYGSNLVQVVDAASHRLLKSIPTQAPEGVAAQGKYVFVTNNDGFLSRIDTASLAVDLQTAVGPNPAGVLALNNYIYVAISDGYNYNDGYKNGFKVLKVRPNTLGIVSEIRVGMNPTKLYKDDFNHVFVACQGNYGTHAAEIWKINENDEATSFAAANLAAVDGHRIYLVRSTTDWTSGKTTVTYAVRDTRTGAAIASNFGQVQPPVDPTSLAVDPHTKQIYIASRGTLDPKIRFTEPGTVSVYTPEGDFLHRYNVGIEPCSLLFLKK